MNDLDTLRFWRAAEPGRAFTLHGPDGSRGVELMRWLRGETQAASYSSVAAAVTAIASGAVRFRAVAAPERGRWGRAVPDPAGATGRNKGHRGGRGGRKQRLKRERAIARRVNA